MRYDGPTLLVDSSFGGIVSDLINIPMSATRSKNRDLLAPMPLQTRNSFSPSNLSLGLFELPEVKAVQETGSNLLKRPAPEAESRKAKSEENESSGSEHLENPENVSGDEQQPKKKKRYHRHTAQQIQAMEALFKECAHPDDKQRLELSRQLNLEPRQVKFWFQNRRTQLKAQHERAENNFYKEQLVAARAQLAKLQEQLRTLVCSHCGGPMHTTLSDQSLIEENVRLKEEVEKVSDFTNKFFIVGRDFPQGAPQFSAGTALPSPVLHGGSAEAEKLALLSSGMLAVDELLNVAEAPNLWVDVPTPHGNSVVFNSEEYFLRYAKRMLVKEPGFKIDATRASGLVPMNAVGIVELLMGPENWTKVFQKHIVKAEYQYLATPETLSGTALLMCTELQVLSPFAPTRQLVVVRQCKQVSESSWVVVDYSADGYQGTPLPCEAHCRRLPSGFVIQDVSHDVNGTCSRVTVVDHMEYDEMINHPLYRGPGVGFSAQAWLGSLQRHVEGGNLFYVHTPEEQNIAKFAQQVTSTYTGMICTPPTIEWKLFRGFEWEVRMTTQQTETNPLLTVASLVSLPSAPQRVFDYLRQSYIQDEWGTARVASRFRKAEGPGNEVSVICVQEGQQEEPSSFVLQDTCWDSSGGTVVHAPVDLAFLNALVRSNCPPQLCAAALPSGFTILPDGTSDRGVEAGGTLLTVAKQVMLSQQSEEALMRTVSVICSSIAETVNKMKGALIGISMS